MGPERELKRMERGGGGGTKKDEAGTKETGLLEEVVHGGGRTDEVYWGVKRG